MTNRNARLERNDNMSKNTKNYNQQDGNKAETSNWSKHLRRAIKVLQGRSLADAPPRTAVEEPTPVAAEVGPVSVGGVARNYAFADTDSRIGYVKVATADTAENLPTAAPMGTVFDTASSNPPIAVETSYGEPTAPPVFCNTGVYRSAPDVRASNRYITGNALELSGEEVALVRQGINMSDFMRSGLKARKACPVMDVTSDDNFRWARERIGYKQEDHRVQVFSVGDSDGNFDEKSVKAAISDITYYPVTALIKGDGWAFAMTGPVKRDGIRSEETDYPRKGEASDSYYLDDQPVIRDTSVKTGSIPTVAETYESIVKLYEVEKARKVSRITGSY